MSSASVELSAPLGPELHVLVLEDSTSDARLMLYELGRQGYRLVHRVVADEAGYREALRDRVDIILADYALPQLDAPRALEILAKQGLDIPLIVVSGSVSDELAVDCIKRGATDYLLKDRLGRLGSAVEHALREKLMRDEQHHAAAVLRSSEERFGKVFRASPAAISISTLQDGRFLDVNDGFLRLTGYAREEVVGRTSQELGMWVGGAERGDIAAALAVRESLRDVETIIRVRDGRLVPVLTSLELIQLDEVPCILGLAQDLTERNRVEAERVALVHEQAARSAAEAAQRRLGFLAEASRLLGASLDYEATIEQVAHTAVPQLADLCLVDILDKDGAIRCIAVAHADPHQDAWAQSLLGRYDASVLQGERGLPAVLRMGASEVATKAVEPFETLYPLVAARGLLEGLRALGPREHTIVPLVSRERVLGALTFLLTDPMRTYGKDDVAIAEDLATRIALAIDNAELYRASQQTLQEREALARQKDEFLAVMSHDLKTPLGTIKLRAQLIQRASARLSDRVPELERVVEGAAMIDRVATRAAAIIDEFVDIAHLERGQALELHPEPMDLLALVREVISECQERTEDQVIRLQEPEGAIQGSWDRVRLGRVLVNLVGNSIKYSPNGGEILVRVGSQAANVPGLPICISVSDHGLGIPAAEVSRVFEHSFRASNVASRIEGSGLGLAGAAHIVTLHGGTITRRES